MPRTRPGPPPRRRRAPCRGEAERPGRALLVAKSSSSPLLRRHTNRLGMRVRRVLVDAPLDLGTEVTQQPLHRPGSAVAEGADGVALDLLGHCHQHVDLALVGAALGHAGEHAPHPAHTLAAGGALAAALMLVEI